MRSRRTSTAGSGENGRAESDRLRAALALAEDYRQRDRFAEALALLAAAKDLAGDSGEWQSILEDKLAVLNRSRGT